MSGNKKEVSAIGTLDSFINKKTQSGIETEEAKKRSIGDILALFYTDRAALSPNEIKEAEAVINKDVVKEPVKEEFTLGDLAGYGSEGITLEEAKKKYKQDESVPLDVAAKLDDSFNRAMEEQQAFIDEVEDVNKEVKSVPDMVEEDVVKEEVIPEVEEAEVVRAPYKAVEKVLPIVNDITPSAIDIHEFIGNSSIVRKADLKDIKRLRNKRIKAAKNHTVYLPNSDYALTMYTMTNQTQRLSYISASEDPTRLLEAIYDRAVIGTETPMSFRQFLKQTSESDIDLIKHALLTASSTEPIKMSISCTNKKCDLSSNEQGRKEFIVDVPVEDMLQYTDKNIYNAQADKFYDDNTIKESIIDKAKVVTVSNGDLVEIRHNSIADGLIAEKEMMEALEERRAAGRPDLKFDNALLITTRLVSKIYEDIGEEGAPSYVVSDNMMDVYELLSTYDTKDIENIIEQTEDLYSKSNVTVALDNIKCTCCGTPIEYTTIDIDDLLFTRVLTLLNQ